MHAWFIQYFILTFECSSQHVIVPMTLLQSISLCVCLYGRPLCLIFHLVLSVVVQWLVKWRGESLWSFVLGAGVTDWAESKGYWALNQPRELDGFFFLVLFWHAGAAYVWGQCVCVCKWYMIYSNDQITLLSMACSSELYWLLITCYIDPWRSCLTYCTAQIGSMWNGTNLVTARSQNSTMGFNCSALDLYLCGQSSTFYPACTWIDFTFHNLHWNLLLWWIIRCSFKCLWSLY